jgi:hypothetical protein
MQRRICTCKGGNARERNKSLAVVSKKIINGKKKERKRIKRTKRMHVLFVTFPSPVVHVPSP